MTSSVRAKMVEQIKAAKQAVKAAEENLKKTWVRARNDKGHLIGDDPSTPDVDEAWVEAKENTPKPTPKKKLLQKRRLQLKSPLKSKIYWDIYLFFPLNRIMV